MGSVAKWDKYKNLSVRISAGDDQELQGSGILYRRELKKPALILTAAHVLKNIEKKFGRNAVCYFDCADCTGEDRQIECVFEEGKSVFFHSQYSVETNDYDVAMIVVPWQEWMEETIVILIKPAEEEKQKGWGFPVGMDKECRKGNKRAGMEKLKGRMDSSIESFRYKLSHKLPNPTKKRESTMKGYSGTGLFEESDTEIRLVGIVSKAAGDETTGGHLWATNAKEILEMIEYYKMESRMPTSLKIYKEQAANEIGRERREETGFFLDCANCLINKENLTPENIFKNDKGAEINLNCNETKKICVEYWKGQLLWKSLVRGVLEKKEIQMLQPSLLLPCSGNTDELQNVELVTICADEKQETVICSLIKKNYFAKNVEHENLKDKMIFVLNGKNATMCDSTVTRRQCRRIMQDIAGEYQTTDREALAQITSNMRDDPYEERFDIVSGQIKKCNLAVFGMGKIRQIWKEGQGNKEKMKQKWERLVEDVWEE